MVIGIISWILIGLITGFIATKFVDLRGDQPVIGMLAAVGGAIFVGILFSIFSGRGVLAWDVWSALWATAGGAVGAVVYHAVRSRTSERGSQSVRRTY